MEELEFMKFCLKRPSAMVQPVQKIIYSPAEDIRKLLGFWVKLIEKQGEYTKCIMYHDCCVITL